MLRLYQARQKNFRCTQGGTTGSVPLGAKLRTFTAFATPAPRRHRFDQPMAFAAARACLSLARRVCSTRRRASGPFSSGDSRTSSVKRDPRPKPRGEVERPPGTTGSCASNETAQVSPLPIVALRPGRVFSNRERQTSSFANKVWFAVKPASGLEWNDSAPQGRWTE